MGTWSTAHLEAKETRPRHFRRRSPAQQLASVPGTRDSAALFPGAASTDEAKAEIWLKGDRKVEVL